MSKNYILISTDLEPDDITFLRVFIKELDNKYSNATNEFPIVHILVGEGNIPLAKVNKVAEILKAAINDKIFAEQFLDEIEILGGSSAKKQNDFVHTFYNENFFNSDTNIVNNINIINESTDQIVKTIKSTKESGGNIIVFGLKPFTDLPFIMEQTKSVLQDTDKLYLSGSYNFREISQGRSDDSIIKLNNFLNEGPYQTTVFEAYTTFEQHALPKEIMHIKDSKYSNLLDKLSNQIIEDKSEVGNIHKLSIEIWNRAVSYDCILDCIKPLLKFKDSVSDVNYKALEDYLNNLEKVILNLENPINKINSDFITTLNNCLFNNMDAVLTGKERNPNDYNQIFKNKFESLDFQNFNWNWKTLGVIAEDPCELLIGDAALAVYFFHPELFQTTDGLVSRELGKSYTIFDEKQSEVNTSLITNVNNYESLIEVLGEELTPGIF